MTKRRSVGLPFWFFPLLALCLGGVVYEGFALLRFHVLHRAMANPATIQLDEHSPAALIFARARYLDQIGEHEEAIRLYSTILHAEDRALRGRVFYNLGTIYLQDAAKRWNARGVLEYARVNTLVELAKANYREALRLNPYNWDARHNLEYAYRITPPPKEKPKSDWQGTKSSVFATLPGIPGGGP